MFDYQLPVSPVPLLGASKPDDQGGKKKPDDKKGPGDKGKDDKQTVHTQMIGEKPGDDLGYDPKIIPTEPIPD